MKKAIIEILLVEDNEYDIELTLRALHEDHLANTIHVARDGEEALAFLADCEARVNGGEGAMPRLILLDLKLPKWSPSAAPGQSQSCHQDYPRGGPHLLQAG
jgi:CheY-like chemotaxis protein